MLQMCMSIVYPNAAPNIRWRLTLGAWAGCAGFPLPMIFPKSQSCTWFLTQVLQFIHRGKWIFTLIASCCSGCQLSQGQKLVTDTSNRCACHSTATAVQFSFILMFDLAQSLRSHCLCRTIRCLSPHFLCKTQTEQGLRNPKVTEQNVKGLISTDENKRRKKTAQLIRSD